MNQSDLAILLREGEGTTLEYKESVSTSFARELVAMANTVGGRILVGVRDDGTVAGVHDTNGERARIQDLARNCDPPVRVLVEPFGNVLVVTVRESESKPVQCREGFFWRQGAASQKLSRDEIREFFQAEGGIRFDLAPCPRFHYPDDFDRARFDAWLTRSRITQTAAVEDVLVNIEAAERAEGGLVFRNAGVLFFAREPQRFFRQAYVTCLLAKGTDKVHVLDCKDFAGGVVADIEDALRFIERNTRMGWRIDGLQRTDVPEYPMRALREAITNAIMHRDYWEMGANVFVEIYADRVEVSNPGGLPKGMVPADLGRKSVRRNPLVADMLHRIGFIEKAGTGIKRMRDEARDQGCAEPSFEVTGFFTATFFPNPAIRATAEAVAQTGSDAASGPTGGAQSRAQSGAQSRAQSMAVLAALGKERRSAAELATLLGLVTKTGALKRTLRTLLSEGLIEYVLPDRPFSRLQQYRTTAAGRAALAGAVAEKTRD
jgi:ATP-dependent DNA helicase RecG